MYQRWIERSWFKSQNGGHSTGEEVGIKSVTLLVTANILRTSANRAWRTPLVRISPFDANKRGILRSQASMLFLKLAMPAD